MWFFFFYVFREKGVDVPLMLNYITTYYTYDRINQESLDEMVDKVKNLAHAFKESEDKTNVAFAMVLFFLGLWFFFGRE